MSKRPFRLMAPRVPEHTIQKQIVDVLRIELAPPGKVSRHGVVFWSVDHAFYGGEAPGARVGRGIVSGIPDLLVLYRGEAFLIEIKSDDGEVSDAQRSVLAAALAASARVAIARDAREVLALLDVWNIPRARRVKEAA
jgi:hypothetical protein